MQISPEVLEFSKTVLPQYIDTAKTYGHLGVGALVLSIGFKEKVLGEVGRKSVTVLLVIAWFLFLLTVGASALYPYLAVKLMEYNLTGAEEMPYPLSWSPLFWPGIWYGIMLISFFLGALLLVVGSARQLFATKFSSRR